MSEAWILLAAIIKFLEVMLMSPHDIYDLLFKCPKTMFNFKKIVWLCLTFISKEPDIPNY